MGFLLKIISAVKDDENLQIYNDRLTEPLEKIKQAQYNRKHFDNSIAAVSQGIKAWVSGVEGKNKAITKPLENLQSRIDGHMSANMDDISITEQLENWQGFSGLYLKEVLASEKALDYIDDNLKKALFPKIDIAKQLVSNFVATVNDVDVINAVKELDDKFHHHRNDVNLYIETKLNWTLSTLSGKFTNIDNKISNVKKTHKRGMDAITGAVKSAHGMADELFGISDADFEKNYKTTITQLFTRLKEKIKTLTDKDSVLMDHFMKANRTIQGLEDDVRAGLQELRKDIVELARDVTSNKNNTLVKQALEDCRMQKEMLDRITGSQELNPTAADNLEYRFQSEIQGKLKSLVIEIDQQIKALGSTFGGNAGNDKKFKGIFDHIRKTVNEIKGDEKKYEGLLGIKTKTVEGYAVRFSKNGTGQGTFGEVVEEWLTHILASKPIAKKLGESINRKVVNVVEDVFTDEGKSLLQVSKAIVGQLVAEMTTAVRVFDSTVKSMPGSTDIEKHVDAVHRVCEEFAKVLEKDIEQKLDKIVNVINVIPPLNASGPTNKNQYLRFAVRMILLQLVGAARQAGGELYALTGDEGDGYNLGKNVDKALSVSSVLSEQLRNAVTSFSISSGYFGNVDYAINKMRDTVGKLNDIFVNDVKRQLDTTVKVFTSTVMSQINIAAEKSIDEAVKKIDNGTDSIVVKNLMKQFYGAREVLITDIGNIQEELKKLESFPHDIDQNTTAAGQTMENLKHRIKEISQKIKAIEEPIETATKSFSSGIENLEAALKSARQTAIFEFALLKSSLQTNVSQAFYDLEDGVQKMFNAQKKTELRALQMSVADHISGLESVIGIDMETGMKGMMDKLVSVISVAPHKSDFYRAATQMNAFFTKFFFDLKSQPDLTPDRLTPLTQALSSLLSTMHQQKHFDHTVSRKLADLQAALDRLTPSSFAEASPLLNVIKAGVRAFHGELAKQYVSRYSKEKYTDKLVKEKTSPDLKAPKSPANSADNTEITEYGRKCAKVFLTSLATLSNDFKHLPQYCKEARFNQIHATHDKYNNKLGDLFSSCGYEVSMYRESHEGELRNKPNFTGTDIHAMIHKKIFDVSSIDHLKQWMTKKNNESDVASTNVSTMNLLQILQFLYECLEDYCSVSHLRHIERPKSPSSVYQMLCWLTGLPHNRVFHKVSVGDIGDLFENPEEEKNDDTVGISVVDDDEQLPAYPAPVTAANIRDALQKVCVDAEDILIGILGHGHADGIYAVDFNTNPDGFSYPTAPGACFDMLCDVLNRLYQQLFFLYSQCSNEEPSVSWRDCWYGNQVGGSAWNCNAVQCANQEGNQIHKQKCNQKCDQTAQCGIKSPLQSFLEDGLPGFLPHSFTKPGCKLTCTLSNHRGIPCRTPMGFADISVTASHRQRGEYLKKVLEDFCGSESAPLTKLCAQLKCLLQKPPQTLGDIFAFYYGYLEEWAGDFYGRNKSQPHRRDAFTEAVNEAYFGKTYTSLNPSILRSSGNHSKHSTGDLISISNCWSGSVAPCGLYVKSVTQEISKYYSSEHQANHLSWIVYITETFYDLLKKLYDDCCNKCGPTGSKCYTKSCDEKCSVKYTTDKTEQVSAVSTEHQPTCKSIVTCRDTHPTLYKYGFTFGNTIVLNGSRGNRGAKRTCNDFCEALKKMLGEGCVLIELRKQIDKFLWDIRQKFSFTVLALWLLSLLYLLHIMVIRLDLLHIKSHLHSPSSHRIAARSLLAAARVNKLGRVFYLQP